MSNGFILSLLAETPLHPGAGQSAGVVDLPVSREGATGLPQIPETGLKGALRSWAETAVDETGEKLFSQAEVDALFGTSEVTAEEGEDGAKPVKMSGGAGELLISTARLLFLPVRRLDAAYAWTTSPYLLSRLKRDAARIGQELNVPAISPQKADQLLLVKAAQSNTVFLEEYSFEACELSEPASLIALVEQIIGADGAEFADRAAIMQDGEFAWFAENALPVDARNSLDDSKISTNLWYEETLPPDTLLYSLILPRLGSAEAMARFQSFKTKLQKAAYLQAGGNETVGHGWLRVTMVGD